MDAAWSFGGSAATFLIEPAIAQEITFFNFYQEMFKKFDRGASKDIYSISVDYKLWIYAYEPKSKHCEP